MQNQVVDNTPTEAKGCLIHHRWHLITGEYPPQMGGVSDYTCGVARGLAEEGDEVDVWCPACAETQPQAEGISVHRELGTISPVDLQQLGKGLDRCPAPRRLLVQWVPHGYGYRSMNVAFCWWVWQRARQHGDQVEIVLHEPSLPFRWRSLRQNVAALVHRLMAIVLLRAATRVWVAIPEWERRWRKYALGRPIPFQWLPIPSNIPVSDDPDAVRQVRRQYASNDLLIGHFGTYGAVITSLLEPILLGLGEGPMNQKILLLGLGSEQYREQLILKQPRLAGRVHSSGSLSAKDLSHHLAACDLFVQPYPDGVSSRRTSAMAALAHGKPIVTTEGPFTEPIWGQTIAVALVPPGDSQAFLVQIQRLATDPIERERFGLAGRKLYREQFDMAHTVRNLRHAGFAKEPLCGS
jgi:glycosyltransferase involved in cell wall biosynthesis